MTALADRRSPRAGLHGKAGRAAEGEGRLPFDAGFVDLVVAERVEDGGDLATGGRTLGLSAETLADIESPHRPAPDRIFGIESAYRFGFMKPFPILDFGTSPRAFGHTGSGGSFAFADPATGVGYAHVMNRAGYTLPTDRREIALRDAIAGCLA